MDFFNRQHLGPEPQEKFQVAIHLSPLIGSVGHLNGLGLGLLGHMSQEADGFVASLGFIYNRGKVRGLQLSPALNITEELSGVQIALFNSAYQINAGAQIALANFDGLVSGLQFGIINWAESLDGLQLGIFNYAERSRGLSIAQDQCPARSQKVPALETNFHLEFHRSGSHTTDLGNPRKKIRS